MTRRFVYAGAAAVLLAAAMSAEIRVAPPASAAPNVYYANYNVAGQTVNNGNYPNSGSLQYLAAVVMLHIFYQMGPSAVTPQVVV